MQGFHAPSCRVARSRSLAIAIVGAALVMATPRETATGRQTAPSALPDSRHIAEIERVQDWLEQTMDGAAGGRRLYEHVQVDRRSFELFVGTAKESGVRTRLRAVPYGASILEAAEQHGVDPLLVAAIAQIESGFDPEAVSPKGARGLMQVMPTTASSLEAGDLFDPAENLAAGAEYLAYLHRRFDDDPVLVIASYNAGPGAVKRFHGVPPYGETRRFTNTVLRVYIAHHRAVWTNFGRS